MTKQQMLDKAIDELDRKLGAGIIPEDRTMQPLDTLQDALAHHRDGTYAAARAVVAASSEEREEREADADAWMAKVRAWAASHPQSDHAVDDSRESIYGDEPEVTR